MSFFRRLCLETEDARQQLLTLPVITQTIQGKVSQERYLAFLAQAYHHVRHTVPLLMACGSRLSEPQTWLQHAIAEYIEEEIGHEQWILNDIEAAGGHRNATRNSLPSFETEVMVAYAYDGIQRRNPVSFFGMVHVLEGTSIALATQAAGKIQQGLELPDTAFSYLRSHGDLDIEHVQFFEKLMDRIEDPDDQQAIIHATKNFYRLYGAVLASLP
ncbi:MAG: iron-containing redox enzyme family protein [Motiliproteus sp.]